MNIFVALLPSGSDISELEIDADAIPRHLRLNTTAWVLASKLDTAAEVGEALKLNRDDDDHDRTWVVFKAVEDGYFGYAVSSLWQKLAAWEAE